MELSTNVEIHHGDCFDVLKSMESNSVDLVITSPPYGDQRKDTYGGIPPEDYPEWFMGLTDEVMRVLKDTGSFVVNIKEHCENGSRNLYVYKMVIMIAEKYNYVDEYIWHKVNPFPTGAKNRLKDAFERCYHFSKTKTYKFFPDEVKVPSICKNIENEKTRNNKGRNEVTNGSGMNMSIRYVEDMVRPSNVISGSSSNINIQHPAVYPGYLPEFFIKLMTEEGDVVFDPFLGSGTTGVEARKSKRDFIGSELMEDYVKLATTRIQAISLTEEIMPTLNDESIFKW